MPTYMFGKGASVDRAMTLDQSFERINSNCDLLPEAIRRTFEGGGAQQPVPGPSTLARLGIGLLGLIGFGLRKRTQSKCPSLSEGKLRKQKGNLPRGRESAVPDDELRNRRRAPHRSDD